MKTVYAILTGWLTLIVLILIGISIPAGIVVGVYATLPMLFTGVTLTTLAAYYILTNLSVTFFIATVAILLAAVAAGFKSLS